MEDLNSVFERLKQAYRDSFLLKSEIKDRDILGSEDVYRLPDNVHELVRNRISSIWYILDRKKDIDRAEQKIQGILNQLAGTLELYIYKDRDKFRKILDEEEGMRNTLLMKEGTEEEKVAKKGAVELAVKKYGGKFQTLVDDGEARDKFLRTYRKTKKELEDKVVLSEEKKPTYDLSDYKMDDKRKEQLIDGYVKVVKEFLESMSDIRAKPTQASTA